MRRGFTGGFDLGSDFQGFARSVRSRARYVFETSVEEFLTTVVETSRSRTALLPAGTTLYRAQLGHRVEACLVDPECPDIGTIDIFQPFSEDRMKPPRDSAREGRVNAKGIPCLYLADDADTAMAETRPWLESLLSLGVFQTRLDLTILECPEPKQFFPEFFIDPSYPPKLELPCDREVAVWGEIAYAFSEPVTPSDITADYAPTQILAEAFRREGFGGIKYKSRLGRGYSFAIFNLDSADLINCSLYSTRDVSFKFEQVGNMHFNPKFYASNDPAE